MSKLTDKQAMFVKEYIIDLNATQAAIRAGYSENSARQIASTMLSNHNIQDAIQKEMDKRSKRTEITQDRVLKELALIGFMDIRKAFDAKGQLLSIPDMPEEVARAIGGIDHQVIGTGDDQIGLTSKIKIIDKKGSLELLGKHLKLFTDKTEVSGALGVVDLSDKSDEELKAIISGQSST